MKLGFTCAARCARMVVLPVRGAGVGIAWPLRVNPFQHHAVGRGQSRAHPRPAATRTPAATTTTPTHALPRGSARYASVVGMPSFSSGSTDVVVRYSGLRRYVPLWGPDLM